MDRIVIANEGDIWSNVNTKEWLIQLCALVVGFNQNADYEKLVVFLNNQLIPESLSDYEEDTISYLDPKFGFPIIDIRYISPEVSYSLKISEEDLKETTKKAIQGFDVDTEYLDDSAIESMGFSRLVTNVPYERLEIPLPENGTIRNILWTIFDFHDKVEIFQAEFEGHKGFELKDIRDCDIERKIALIETGYKGTVTQFGAFNVVRCPDNVEDFWLFSSPECPIVSAKIQDEKFLTFERERHIVTARLERKPGSVDIKGYFGFDQDGTVVIYEVCLLSIYEKGQYLQPYRTI